VPCCCSAPCVGFSPLVCQRHDLLK
jgi:hypothetical protein